MTKTSSLASITASRQTRIQKVPTAIISTVYRISLKPRAVQRVGRVRQEAAEATQGDPIPGQYATVRSEASEESAKERFPHARPVGSVQPPKSGSGGGSLGGIEPGAAEKVARREYEGARPHSAWRRQQRAGGGRDG